MLLNMAPVLQNSSTNDLVIVVHGLWMHGLACAVLAHRLRHGGFRVETFSYPSVRWPLSVIAARLHDFARSRSTQRVHFVGHSLGGLVILNMLSAWTDLPPGRVVLLGSPCTDCESARQLGARSGGRLVLGRALHGWSCEDGEAVAHRLPVGVIAGTRRIGMGRLFVRLSGPNDGVVTVEETRLPGRAAHRVMPVSHSGMLVSSAVAEQVVCFLREGRFTGDGARAR